MHICRRSGKPCLASSAPAFFRSGRFIDVSTGLSAELACTSSSQNFLPRLPRVFTYPYPLRGPPPPMSSIGSPIESCMPSLSAPRPGWLRPSRSKSELARFRSCRSPFWYRGAWSVESSGRRGSPCGQSPPMSFGGGGCPNGRGRRPWGAAEKCCGRSGCICGGSPRRGGGEARRPGLDFSGKGGIRLLSSSIGRLMFMGGPRETGSSREAS